MELSLEIPDDFFHWILESAEDPEIRQLDPYRDTQINSAIQRRWIEELNRIERSRTRELRSALQDRHRLPSDPAAREKVLSTLVERELVRNPRWRMLRDVVAVLALAVENDATIQAYGD